MGSEPDHRELDWTELHARIARAAEATTRQLEPTAEEVRRILATRARELARVVAPPAAGADVELAFFSSGGEQFAIDADHVVEVSTLPEIEAVPWVPAVFRGVGNYRGEVLPVVDLRVLLTGKPQTGVSKWMIVLGRTRAELALPVDVAEEVTRVPLDAIRRDALSDALASFPFLRGIHLGHRLVIDGDALLRDPRLSIRDGA